MNLNGFMAMDSDLNELKDLIVNKFIDKGLAPWTIFEFIQYLARSIFIKPELSLFEIREELYHLNLPQVDLDDALFQCVKECVVKEGRRGIEYRFGEGFSYLVPERKPPISPISALEIKF